MTETAHQELHSNPSPEHTGDRLARDQGGDPACWMSRVCPECGGFIEDDTTPHHCPHHHRVEPQ